MKITNMVVNKFDQEETDLVVEVEFSDKRKELDEPTFTVAIQNNAITSIISDNGQGDVEFDFSAEEEQQIRQYISDNYSFKKNA